MNEKRPVPSAEVDATFEHELEALGIYDGWEEHELPSDYRTAIEQADRRSGVFMRGATAGGSPVLNLATRASSVLLILMAGLLGVGGWMAFSSLVEKGPAEVAAPQLDGEYACIPQADESAGPGNALLPQIPEIVRGGVQLPRDRETLTSLGAISSRVGQDRVDVFQPDYGRLAVRYSGDGPTVLSASLVPNRPVELCDALEATALLPHVAGFDMQGDWVSPVDGRPAEALSDLAVRVRREDGAVTLLQFVRR